MNIRALIIKWLIKFGIVKPSFYINGAETLPPPLGTAEETDAAKALVREAEEDIEPIDGLVAFAHSDAAAGIFGAEGVKAFAAHAVALAASGAKYCDCPACTACAAILSRKADLLG